MIDFIVFDNEITVWWDLEEFKNAKEYELYLNGAYHGKTSKTHYSFLGLEEKRAYQVRVEACIDESDSLSWEYQIKTKKSKKRLDVTKAPYNAVGDGETLNTLSLQKALDDCSQNEYVYIPKGNYLSGALDVRSDTEIYIDEGAILQGSINEKDYLPKVCSRFEGTERECYRSFINVGKLDREAGYTTKNVVIRGKGAIYGGGAELAKRITEVERERLQAFLKQNADYVKTCENENTIPARARGRLININNTENVILSGLSLGYGASWNVHFVYSKDIITYGCSISSVGVFNGDGWDPDSSENCVIFDTVFDTQDNAIAIKSGKNPEGNVINIPTKNVYIFDCRGKNDVAIGSELSGGVENVFVWDCHFFDSWGINIKTTPSRGGYIKNVRVQNSEVSSITVRTRFPCNDDGAAAGYLTELSDFYFEDLVLQGVFTADYLKDGKQLIPVISIDGFKNGASIKNVTFRNVKILPKENGEMQEIKCRNVINLEMEKIKFE